MTEAQPSSKFYVSPFIQTITDIIKQTGWWLIPTRERGLDFQISRLFLQWWIILNTDGWGASINQLNSRLLTRQRPIFCTTVKKCSS